jgi:hypothetical protein
MGDKLLYIPYIDYGSHNVPFTTLDIVSKDDYSYVSIYNKIRLQPINRAPRTLATWLSY